MLLAGGQGDRLQPLTLPRSKPSVPFGGKYRIIDFPLSNCLNSGLRRIYVLTQYKSDSLNQHIFEAWSIFNPELGEFIYSVPPQRKLNNDWYMGTANAIYQNLNLFSSDRKAKRVLILSGIISTKWIILKCSPTIRILVLNFQWHALMCRKRKQAGLGLSV
jgi:glucose-1-phosphate adenylyltransferase